MYARACQRGWARIVMEKSFKSEIELLRLGNGETFHGEGILAITKALLQSGVSYVGGYQGAPVSHLLDVMVQSSDYMKELGVHVEACSNEASAAAMLGASIHYPIRGAVTWKSIVGTNVAADALSNLSSPGVKGGALIVVGEDYGEGASVIQERTHAYALKSTMLSETSNMPALLELRIRTCHVRGSFECKDNVAPAISTRNLLEHPADFDYARLAHPPVTFRHEKLKGEQRVPAARAYIAEHKLNELFAGRRDDVGLIVQGGLYNSLIRALQMYGLADAFGETEIPILALNATFPLVPEEIAGFCLGKRAVMILEEGQPDFIEQDILTSLRRGDINTPVHGKDMLSAAGLRVWRNSARATCPRLILKAARPGAKATPRVASILPRNCPNRCRRARPVSASDVPSGRCFLRSNWRNAMRDRYTLLRT
jgi:indolepyruvate ferredoxin oxidoreductase alpha subunit